MSDVDALLDEVLTQDARVSAPSGMEQRIFANVMSGAKNHRRNGRLWISALAATVLLAAGWTLLRAPRLTTKMVAPQRVALALGGAAETARPQLLRESVEPVKFVPTGLKHHRRVERDETIRIDPIEIAPVVIQPIELASLSADAGSSGSKIWTQATTKGKLQ